MDHILYKNNRIVLSPLYDDPKAHKHFAKHILICSRAFHCLTEGTEKTGHSMLIQSQKTHRIIREPNSKMLVFLIDETSSLSKWMDERYFKDSFFNTLSPCLEQRILHFMEREHSLHSLDRYVMEHLEYQDSASVSYDERVLWALDYIEKTEEIEKEIYEKIPNELCISKSRFLHLFKDEVGIDLKNYLLIKKMEKTYHYVIKKKMNITQAAILSGFSSSSHFSDACKKHYGISLTAFIHSQLLRGK